MSGAVPESVRAYVDHPISDRAGAERLAFAAAEHWDLAERPALVRAGMNVTFASGDVIVRVGEPSVPGGVALALARFLADNGVRVPAPARPDAFVADALSATAWERVVDVGGPIEWAEVGRTIRRVHEFDPAALPAGVPLPLAERFAWWNFEALFERAGDLDAAAAAGLHAAVDAHRGWVDTTDRVVCHGDVHPGNVIMSASGPVLIDWDLLCWAPRAWDHGPMMTWAQRWGGAAGEYEAFADGYGASLRGDPVAESLATLRLVAATLMRVIAGRGGDAAAAAEAECRLRWWRGDPDAPAWRAQ